MKKQAVTGAIVGHTNMDLDCLGSIALARYLFPGYVAIQSRHVHPAARMLVTMYRDHLELMPSKDFRGCSVDHLVVVDTRSKDRVSEYLDLFEGPPKTIEVFDHHPGDSRDIPGALVHESTLGSNTTFLGSMLMERDTEISPDDATIALAGVFADTGSFTHGNVTAEDFQVASYFLSSGASMSLVKTFVSPLRERIQVSMFHEVIDDLVGKEIRGHSILLSYTELEGPTQGLSPVVEKIFEIENPDAYFAVFSFQHNGSALIISRNQKDSIELDHLMGAFGGGGHKKAASATVKGVDGKEVFKKLEAFLESSLMPALTASDLMTPEVDVIAPGVSLVDAAMFLEEIDHTGCPVVEEDGHLVGFITLRDIMKGRRAGQMHAPVKGYMTRKVIHTGSDATVREIEDLLLTNNIGHLPILEGEKMVGIVTRTDYLLHRKEEKEQIQAVKDSLQ